MKPCQPFIKMLPINLRISLCLPLRVRSSGPVRIAKPKLLANVEMPASLEAASLKAFEKTALDGLFAEGAFCHCGGFAEIGDTRFLEG